MYKIATTDINKCEVIHSFATREQFDTAYWNFMKDNKVHTVNVL